MTTINRSTDSSGQRKQPDKTMQEMLQESRQCQAEVSALLKGSRAVLEYRDFEDAARAIFDSCKDIIGATSGYIALLSNDGTENEVLFLDSGGFRCTVDPSLPMPIRGLRETVFQSGKTVFENEFSQSQWSKLLPEGHARLDNVLFAPLAVHQKVVGLLGIANKPGGFCDDDARAASAFAELAAIALQNSRTLEALESSEDRFRSLTQSANDGIISADSAGCIVYCNDAVERLFGYPADDITGRPLASLIPRRFHEAHERGMSRVVSGGKSTIIGKTVEVVGRRADGSEFPVELSLSTWETKEETFFTGILRDMTERKRAEEQIELLAAFPSENPDPVIRVKHDGTLMYANEASRGLLHLWYRDVDQAIPEPLSTAVSSAFASDQRADIEVECHDRTVVITVVPVVGAGYLNLYGRDITERKRVEEKIEFLAAFPSENPDPVMRVKHDGTLMYANEASRGLLHLWNRDVGQMVPEPLSATVSSAFASDQRADIEVECDDRTIVITVVPVVKAGYLNLYGRDITERKWARHFLEIANRHGEMRPLLEEVAAEVKRITGCAAVGIRVVDDDGGTCHQASDGLTGHCYQSEGPLWNNSQRCICSALIQGKTDGLAPFITKGGSFHANDMTPFVRALPESQTGVACRLCREEGYHSMALMPIRMGSRILGLIHAADRQDNAISRECVEGLERIGMQLGTAVQRVRAEEALHRVNEELEARVGRRTAELERTNRELKGEIAERQRLEKEVLGIGMQEQRRIGQELHDGLGQELTGLSYLATSLHRKLRANGVGEAETAEELAEGIPRVLGHVQRIVKGLVPLELDTEDLVPALQALVAGTEERTGISCSFKSNAPVKVHDNNVAVQLYRIAQEAVTNAVKHGQARHIDVVIRVAQSQITLQVFDDGAGMPLEAGGGSGSGMNIMRYRARVIGGTLEINPGTGGGTLVTCSLPWEQSDGQP